MTSEEVLRLVNLSRPNGNLQLTFNCIAIIGKLHMNGNGKLHMNGNGKLHMNGNVFSKSNPLSETISLLAQCSVLTCDLQGKSWGS